MVLASRSASPAHSLFAPGAHLSFADYNARKYLPELDGLRAISILLVITVHMADDVWHWLNGGFGVLVFFVLSGYLITMLALREERRRGQLDMGAFYIRRAFRIFPLYYLVLAAYIVLILVVKIAPDKIPGFAPALPYFAFYFPEVAAHMGPHGSALPFYQAWSLGIEEKFYFVWPVLAFVLLKGKTWPRRILTLALILLLVFYIYWAPWFGAYPIQSYAHILFGALLALLLDEPQAFASMQRFSSAIFPLTLLSLAALQFSNIPSRYPLYTRSVYGLLIMLLLAALVTTQGWMNRVLSLKTLVFIGKLSYGMYLVHILCLNIVEKLIHPGSGLALPAYLATCAVTIAAAWLLHLTVERPMINFGKSLLRRRELTVAIPSHAVPTPLPERQL